MNGEAFFVTLPCLALLYFSLASQFILSQLSMLVIAWVLVVENDLKKILILLLMPYSILFLKFLSTLGFHQVDQQSTLSLTLTVTVTQSSMNKVLSVLYMARNSMFSSVQ